MQQVKSFERESTRLVQEAAVKALKATAEQFGLSVNAAGGTIDGESATLKFRFRVVLDAEGRKAESEKAKKVFAALAEGMGLEPEWFGKRFIDRRHSFEIVGLNHTSYPVNCKREDGKLIRYKALSVRALMMGRAA